MKWNIDDLPVFAAVADTLSISGAAERLGMPKSTVSRTLSRLEDDLDLRLFDRNSRTFKLTAEGESFLDHARAIVEQAQRADAAIAGLRHQPSGTLKVSMPMAFSREVIGGKLAAFNRLYPDIVLQMRITSYPVNMLREDLDLALMVGPLADSTLIAQQIFDSPLIWVASADYVHRHEINTLAALRPHLKFCEQRYLSPQFQVRTPRGRQTLDTSALMSINDPVILRDIALDGGGVALLPALYCQHPVAAGQLIRICPDILPQARASLLALTPTRRLQPQKAHLFIEFVKNCLDSYLRG